MRRQRIAQNCARIAPELRQNCARGVQVGDVPRVEAEGVGEPLVRRDHRHVHPRLRLLDVRDLGPRLPRRLRVLAVPVVLVDAVRARRHRAVAVLQRHCGQRCRAGARRARRRDRRADARRGQHDPRRQRARRREGGEEELGAHLAAPTNNTHTRQEFGQQLREVARDRRDRRHAPRRRRAAALDAPSAPHSSSDIAGAARPCARRWYLALARRGARSTICGWRTGVGACRTACEVLRRHRARISRGAAVVGR